MLVPAHRPQAASTDAPTESDCSIQMRKSRCFSNTGDSSNAPDPPPQNLPAPPPPLVLSSLSSFLSQHSGSNRSIFCRIKTDQDLNPPQFGSWPFVCFWGDTQPGSHLLEIKGLGRAVIEEETHSRAVFREAVIVELTAS